MILKIQRKCPTHGKLSKNDKCGHKMVSELSKVDSKSDQIWQIQPKCEKILAKSGLSLDCIKRSEKRSDFWL